VKIDGIGTFKISFKGDGLAAPEMLTASNIDRSSVRVTFVADSTMKQELQSEISFSKVPEKHNETKKK
ncbi:MAG: hypothetical protein K2J14_01825, partial [Treponemataceae bacterium]|nr:hypothetical protein [Treponemataceae bacterium]